MDGVDEGAAHDHAIGQPGHLGGLGGRADPESHDDRDRRRVTQGLDRASLLVGQGRRDLHLERDEEVAWERSAGTDRPLARNRDGELRIARTYTFEFSDTGNNRREGAVVGRREGRRVGEDDAHRS